MRQASKSAAVWFARRRAAPLGGQEQSDFEAWLTQDAEHAIAYADAERAWAVAEAVRDDPRIRTRRETLSSGRPPRRLPAQALAAGLAIAVLGGGASMTVQHFIGPKSLANQAFRTEVGQRSTVTLPDGSLVTLNTDTVLRTRADGKRRLVYLDKGQAYFKVAKDRRHPFVVTAAGRTVTALGTAFDVRVNGRELTVVLVEGKVRVEGPPPAPPGASRRPQPSAPVAAPPGDVQATEMLAGSELVAPDNSEWRLAPADIVRETSWTRGQLVFDDEPLGAVVAELNRYTDRKMVIDDPMLAARPISGAFKPGDVQGFARSLQTYRYAYVAAEDGQTLHFAPMKPVEKKSSRD
ncbi:MAG: FecR family protein [Ignavibacteriales bacterium]